MAKEYADETGEKTKYWPILILIRKSFVCLDSMLTHLDAEAANYTSSFEAVLDL